MADPKPTRIRWHEETDPPGFTGHVGTVGEFLFRVYAPTESGGEHMLLAYMPGYSARASYGTEAEVKAEAERWLTEFASSLGAIFPPAREYSRDWDDKPVSRIPAIPAGPWEVVGGA
jgi:hypothetical protein